MTMTGTPKYIRCPQGHIFDSVQHGSCPKCGASRPKPSELVKATKQSQGERRSKSVNRPGGELYNRPLHFIWLVDCSGSMVGEKMASVNYAIRSVIPEMQQKAIENPNVQILIRVVAFSEGASWHVEEPIPLAEFEWEDLTATPRAVTDLGDALALVAEAVRSPPMPERALPPVLVLMTDGEATDSEGTVSFDDGLADLLSQDGGRKAVRVSIAIGRDADLAALERFSGDSIKPLRAHNATQIVKFIEWVSTTLVSKPLEGESGLQDAPPEDDGPVVF